MTLHFSQVGIIGAGAMGRGIAQLAAQAGSSVFLFDTQSSASAAAQTAVFSQWDKLQDKGRLEQAQVAGYKSRLHCVASLAELASCQLVVEAIVERLDAKADLFSQLEELLTPDAVLASNTSSLSITALGVAAGATSPYQTEASKPGNPDSAMVGTSGKLALRLGLSTASTFKRPLRTWGKTSSAFTATKGT